MANPKEFKIKHESIDAVRKVAEKYNSTEECLKQVDFKEIKKQLNLNANELKYIESILNGIYAGVDTEEIAAAICRDNAVSAYDKDAPCVVTFGKSEEKSGDSTSPVENPKADTTTEDSTETAQDNAEEKSPKEYAEEICSILEDTTNKAMSVFRRLFV